MLNIRCQAALAHPVSYRPICPLLQKNKYALNATQELRGLGVANLFGAAFNCYTTTGSFSRSAVNNEVGWGRWRCWLSRLRCVLLPPYAFFARHCGVGKHRLARLDLHHCIVTGPLPKQPPTHTCSAAPRRRWPTL